ncbi:MAG: DUF2914 domain-containing protein [Deltaproteobacteria bacterium]|nr:DUF2914 domain-containing protein [Deltaproteobacteria bacterium]
MKTYLLGWITLITICLILGPAGSTFSENVLSVEVVVVARDIKDLTPVGVAEGFPADVGRVYCYSKIVGAQTDDVITHVWLYNERVVANIPLEIKADVYRTYSYKTIPSEWKGVWRVEIRKGETILKTVGFTIE